MRLFSTPQNSSPPDDELAVSDSLYHRDHPNTMSSFNRLAQTSPPDLLTSTNPQARRFPSIGRTRTGTSPNVSVAPNTFDFSANTLSYPSDTSSYPANCDGYMESNVSSNRYFPYHREDVTTAHTMMGNTARPQNYYSTDSMHYDSYDVVIPPACPVTYECQPSSGYGGPVRNPSSSHGAQHHNTPQGGADGWYSGTLVTGGNLPPSHPLPMQYPDGYTPYPPQYALPDTNASSSSYREPSSHHRPSFYPESSPQYALPDTNASSSFFREPSSYRRPSFYPESSPHYPETYHGSWPQSEDPAIRDPPLSGSSLPEQPGPSMAPSPSATKLSHSYLGHGDDMSNPSYRPPSVQPHQDLPFRNSHSHQNSQRRRGSHSTHETHHSPSTTYSCGWLVGENTICRFKGPLDAFKTHFMRCHLTGAQNALNRCHWQDCQYQKRADPTIHDMRRDTTWRHVREKHLKIKRGT